MTDTNLPHSSDLVPRHLTTTNKHGHRIRVEHARLCDLCPYGSNSVCKLCMFNAVNIQGVRAAFSPKESYRKAHQDDISASPMMQQFKTLKPIDWHVAVDNVLPNPSHIVKGVKLPFFPVKSFQSMLNTLGKLNEARKKGGIV